MHALIFRAVGIFRPILLLILIRWTDLAGALVYAAVVSRYVICAEAYNLLFPTDGLYKKESDFGEAVAVSARRMRVATPVAILSALALWAIGVNILDACLTSVAALVSAIAIPFYSHAFPRLRLGQLASVEMLFHLGAAVSVGMWFTSGRLWFVLAFALLETPLKTICVLIILKAQPSDVLRSMLLSMRSSSIFLEIGSGVKIGYPLTLANYFFRLPFALPFASGVLDPLFMLVAQMVSSAYNLILVIHSKRLLSLIQMTARISLVFGLLLIPAVMAMGKGTILAVQFVIALLLALPYAFWLSKLSGSAGLLAYNRYRFLVIGSLNAILVISAFTDPRMIILALALPCYYHLSAHRGELDAKG